VHVEKRANVDLHVHASRDACFDLNSLFFFKSPQVGRRQGLEPEFDTDWIKKPRTRQLLGLQLGDYTSAPGQLTKPNQSCRASQIRLGLNIDAANHQLVGEYAVSSRLIFLLDGVLRIRQ
jgi:hypothetical protein